MNITVNKNHLTIFLEGRIDTSNASTLEEEIMSAINGTDEVSDITVDAEKLQYISSAGLRVLMKLRKSLNQALPMVNVSREVYEILETTGFTELFDVKKAFRKVSIDGCELIGSGGYGKVYRLDPETIVKVYSPNISLEFIEQERNTSQKAFLMGVPTAISYDVVKCDDSYGVIYELLDAKTTAQIISKDPTKIPEIFGKSAAILKQMHQIVPGADSGLPNRKEKLLSWLDSITEFLSQDESEKIKNFISNIPDRDTFLHGDYNAKNVMIKDDEFLLIDIGDAAIGHPVFDIAGLMLAYIILPNIPRGVRSDEDIKNLLGFNFEYAPQVWGVMCGTYFGLSSPEEIGAITQKLMPYCLLLQSFHSITLSGNNKEEVAIRVDKVIRERLLPSLNNVAPLDF